MDFYGHQEFSFVVTLYGNKTLIGTMSLNSHCINLVYVSVSVVSSLMLGLYYLSNESIDLCEISLIRQRLCEYCLLSFLLCSVLLNLVLLKKDVEVL